MATTRFTKAERLQKLPPYLFAEIDRKKKAAIAAGRDVINLGVGDPDRPYLEDTPENHWLWLSDSDREAYRDLKNSSREAYRRSDFMIGVAVVNRIISVIDAVRDAKRANRRLDDSFTNSDGFNYRFSIDPLDPDTQVTLTIYTPF